MGKFVKIDGGNISFYDDKIHFKTENFTVPATDEEAEFTKVVKVSTIPADAKPISDEDYEDYINNQHIREMGNDGKVSEKELPPEKEAEKSDIEAIKELMLSKGLITGAEIKDAKKIKASIKKV